MSNDVFICNEGIKIFNSLKRVLFNKDHFDTQSYASSIVIGSNTYQKNMIIEEIDIIVRLIRREWFQFQNIALYDATIGYQELINSRELISSAFEHVIESIQMCENLDLKEKYIIDASDQLGIFSSSLLPLITLDSEFILKIFTCMSNSKSPIYLYIHTLLDINNFLLVFDIYFMPIHKIEGRLDGIMRDLILLSKTNYNRQKIDDRSVFICPCMKKFWLIIQLLAERKDVHMFWKIFNNILENENPNFSIWLLKEIAFLHMYNNKMENIGKRCDRIQSNYILLEDKLKLILSEADSEMMVDCFSFAEPLICDLWLSYGKIEVYQIIWDYFSKRLNVTNKTTYTVNNALEFTELIDIVMWCPKDCKEDFEYFVGMLLCHLREYPMHWGKIKGRIYSQLGPNKVKDLSDVGIKHVMILFLSLASINFEELFKKIVSFLESLPEEKKNSYMYWNIYTSFIMRHVRDGRSIEKVSDNVVKMLLEASGDQKSYRLIKEFLLNYDCIINVSLNLELHQWLLINQWLPKYLSTCYYQDLNASLNIFLGLLDKVNSPDLWSLWEPTFKDHVFPSLKQIATTLTAPGIVGKIAAKISLLITSSTKEAFNFFNGENVSAKVSYQFLNVILEYYPNNYILTPQQEIIVIQSWVKICLLSTESTEGLTRNIVKLDSFPLSLKSLVANSGDPLMTFIEYIGNDKSHSIIKLSDVCFGQLHQWLQPYLAQPENEAIILRIHTVISRTFLHCGHLLYNRNKSTCPLTQLVATLLLPTEFLVGKIPHQFILNGIKKTWNIYFEAIVKLNTVPDGFLERTLRDLITKYMPYFSTADSPMLKCFENEATANFLLDKICVAYFKHPMKESDANILKALKIIHDFVESTTSENLLRLIINKTLYGLFEVVIFHAQRNMAIGVIKSITCSPLYKNAKDDFGKVIIAITDKHLAFNTNAYFQLINILSKFIPSDLKLLLGDIKTHLANVERMRGVGFDKTLRQHMEKLEKTLDVS